MKFRAKRFQGLIRYIFNTKASVEAAFIDYLKLIIVYSIIDTRPRELRGMRLAIF
jgi:hypothetical protein